MPRRARLHVPGALVHVTSRFVGFAIPNDAALRAHVLDAIAVAVARTDWIWLGYALMTNHLHLALVAGDDPPERLFRAANTAIARRINRACGRTGRLFSSRPGTYYKRAGRAQELLAYIHNNPVRASVVERACDSCWTSAAAYEPRAEPMTTLLLALNTHAGLLLCGLENDTSSRVAFTIAVDAAASRPRAKGTYGFGHTPGQVHMPDALSILQARGAAAPRGRTRARTRRFEGEALHVRASVCTALGVTPEQLSSRSQRRALVFARRVVMLVWVMVRRTQIEMARELQLSGPAASYLINGLARRNVDPRAWDAAERIALAIAA